MGKLTKSALPRSKYDSRLKQYIAFSKRRKKPHRLERKAALLEFGAKVHQVQVGAFNFIERLDFEAFHEGNRLEKSRTLNSLLKQLTTRNSLIIRRDFSSNCS